MVKNLEEKILLIEASYLTPTDYKLTDYFKDIFGNNRELAQLLISRAIKSMEYFTRKGLEYYGIIGQLQFPRSAFQSFMDPFGPLPMPKRAKVYAVGAEISPSGNKIRIFQTYYMEEEFDSTDFLGNDFEYYN